MAFFISYMYNIMRNKLSFAEVGMERKMEKKKRGVPLKRWLAAFLCAVLVISSGTHVAAEDVALPNEPQQSEETEQKEELQQKEEVQQEEVQQEEPASQEVIQPEEAPMIEEMPTVEEPPAAAETEKKADNCGIDVSFYLKGYGEDISEKITLTMPEEYYSFQDYGFPAGEKDPGYYTVLHVLAEYAFQSGHVSERGEVWGTGKLDVNDGFLIDWFGYNEALGVNGNSSGAGFMYIVDGTMPDVGMSLMKAAAGMNIIIYDAWWYYSGSIYESGAYCEFGEIPQGITAQKSFPVQLNVIGGDADNIQIEILDANGDVVDGVSAPLTDKAGKTSVIIPEAGEYTLTAMKYSGYYDNKEKKGQLITRPFAEIAVGEGEQITDEQAIERVKESLTLPQSVDSDMQLSTGGDYGVTIKWSSSNSKRITETGKVTRPAIKDEPVTLTAVLTKNGLSAEKEIVVTVVGQPVLKSLSIKQGALNFDPKAEEFTVYVKKDTKEIELTLHPEEAAQFYKLTSGGKTTMIFEMEEQTHSIKLQEEGVTDIAIAVNLPYGNTGTVTVHVKKADNPGESLEDLPNNWGQHLGTDSNNAITEAKPPVEAGELLWESIGEEPSMWGTAYAGSPILVNDKIYVVRNKQLQVLEQATGKLLESADLAGDVSFYCYPTYGEGKIFVPLGDGSVQCFNALTLKSLFITHVPKSGMTGLSAIHYRDGMIYVGYTNGAWSDDALSGGFAAYETVDLDKEVPNELVAPAWVYEGNGSYYGMGAVTVSTAGGEYLVFAGDDGTVVSADPKTGEVKSTKQVGGKVRCSLVYAEGAVWFTSQDGMIHKFAVGTDGTLAQMSQAKLPGTTNSSPVISKGKVYVTGGVWQAGYFSVFDTELKLLAEEKAVSETSGPFNTPTVTEAYGETYVYFTHNASPDKLFVAKVTAENKITMTELYTSPKEHANYCLSKVVVGADGTVYYGNDSGYLIAIKAGKVQPEPPKEEPELPKEETDKKEDEKIPPKFTTNPGALQNTSTRTLKATGTSNTVKKSKSRNIAEGILTEIDAGKTSLTIKNVPEKLEAEVFEALAKQPDFRLILDFEHYTISMKGEDVTNTAGTISGRIKEKTIGKEFALEFQNDGELPGKMTVVYKIPEKFKDAAALYLYERDTPEDIEEITIKEEYCMFTLEKSGTYILTDTADYKAEPVALDVDDEMLPKQGETKKEIPTWLVGVIGVAGGLILGVGGTIVFRRKRKKDRVWEEE